MTNSWTFQFDKMSAAGRVAFKTKLNRGCFFFSLPNRIHTHTQKLQSLNSDTYHGKFRDIASGIHFRKTARLVQKRPFSQYKNLLFDYISHYVFIGGFCAILISLHRPDVNPLNASIMTRIYATHYRSDRSTIL